MHPTIALLGLDLALTVVGTALWVVAVVLARGSGDPAGAARRGDLLAASAAVAATVALVGRAVCLVAAGDAGWWFVGDRVALGLPLAVAGALAALVGALPALVRGARGLPVDARRRGVATASLLTAVVGSVGALAATTLVGYPVAPLAAGWLVALAAGATGIGWAVLVARPPRRVQVSAGVAYALALVLAGGWAWADDAAARVGPVALHAGTGGHAAPAPGPWAGDTAGEPSPRPGPAPADGPAVGSGAPPATSVTTLRTPPDAVPGGTPVRRYALTARAQQVTLPSGTTVDALTFGTTFGTTSGTASGSLPGPELTATQGDLVEVTLRNDDLAAGVTLHWHGYDVPNGEDGVAGVTQDAVGPGEEFVYRFVADQAGTYWYHTHQSSARGVQRGLYGTLVVHPAHERPADVDLTLAVHTLDGTTLLGGSDVPVAHGVAAGSSVRLRLVNTDQVPRRFSVSGAQLRVLAVDGEDLHGPQDLGGPSSSAVLRVPAGGRYDVGLTMPGTGDTSDVPDAVVRLAVEGSPRAGLVLGAPGTAAPAEVPFDDGPEVDLLDYGTPDRADPGRAGDRLRAADAGTRPDAEAVIVLDRLVRPVHGVPTYAWTVNGRVWPHVPPIDVHEGDLVRLVVVNRSTETHPVHPHGHDVEVVSRDGVAPRGSPLHLDTFDVRPGEVWEVLLRADNPGLWMSHCHNLDHAALGMVLHLAYAGVTTPYELGGHGSARPNDPE